MSFGAFLIRAKKGVDKSEELHDSLVLPEILMSYLGSAIRLRNLGLAYL